MLVLGYCKLTSKKVLPMTKVQCVRDYTPEEVARLNGVGGSWVEDIWIYQPLLDKLTSACISKEMLISNLEPVDELDNSLLYKVQHVNGSNYLYWYVSSNNRYKVDFRKVIYTTNAIESLNSTYRKLNRQRSVFPSDTALLKALYLATFEATKKWTMSIRNWGQVYGELSIMCEGRLPE